MEVPPRTSVPPSFRLLFLVYRRGPTLHHTQLLLGGIRRGPLVETSDASREKPDRRNDSGRGRYPHIWYCQTSGAPDIWTKSAWWEDKLSAGDIRAVRGHRYAQSCWGGHHANQYFIPPFLELRIGSWWYSMNAYNPAVYTIYNIRRDVDGGCGG